MISTANDFRRPIIEQLELALAEAQQHEEQSRAAYEAAKNAHHDAKQQTKEIVSLLRICKRESGGGLTKETLRPYVTAVLNKTGPLSEVDLRNQLQKALKQKGLPRTGITLVMRSLRKEFADEQGTWQVRAKPTSP